MQLCFLKTKDLIVPSNIKVLEDFGYEQVWSNDTMVAEGNVIYIEGEPDDIIS